MNVNRRRFLKFENRFCKKIILNKYMMLVVVYFDIYNLLLKVFYVYYYMSEIIESFYD